MMTGVCCYQTLRVCQFQKLAKSHDTRVIILTHKSVYCVCDVCPIHRLLMAKITQTIFVQVYRYSLFIINTQLLLNTIQLL